MILLGIYINRFQFHLETWDDSVVNGPPVRVLITPKLRLPSLYHTSAFLSIPISSFPLKYTTIQYHLRLFHNFSHKNPPAIIGRGGVGGKISFLRPQRPPQEPAGARPYLRTSAPGPARTFGLRDPELWLPAAAAREPHFLSATSRS